MQKGVASTIIAKESSDAVGRRPARALLFAVALALGLAVVAFLGLGWLSAQRLDLLHVAFINGCNLRAYQVHWQDWREYPQAFPFDFNLSPESLVLLVVWLESGETITVSRPLPLNCATGLFGQ